MSYKQSYPNELNATSTLFFSFFRSGWETANNHFHSYVFSWDISHQYEQLYRIQFILHWFKSDYCPHAFKIMKSIQQYSGFNTVQYPDFILPSENVNTISIRSLPMIWYSVHRGIFSKFKRFSYQIVYMKYCRRVVYCNFVDRKK